MKQITIVILAALLLFSCSPQKKNNNVSINEIFQTVRDTLDNVDSPAFWQGPNGENWIISTAKETDVLIVDDASTGKNIKRVGGTGTQPGKMDRPNGIFVIDDIAFIVERDNHRVQAFRLPGFNSLGTFGDTLLVKPYGLFVYKAGDNYKIYVTDNYETEDGQVPPDNELNKRVHLYNVSIQDSTLSWSQVKIFGDTTGDGRLKVVESIFGDVDNNKLLISEEDMTQSSFKVYDLDGNFTGEVLGRGKFDGQVEGLTLYKCGSDKGYWIVTNQSYDDNSFLIFDRTDFNFVGKFAGPKTSNTDGIWIAPVPYANFVQGAFFAVNDDGNVSSFDWKEIMDKLDLKYCD